MYKWCEVHKTNESWPVTKWKTIRQREAGATGWWAVARTFFSEWQIDFFGRPTFTTPPLSFIKSGAQTAHRVHLGQFELTTITELPNRSLSWRCILFHIWRKRTIVRSKSKSFVSKVDKAQKKRCKVSKINTGHEIQSPRLYLDFYENHCQLFVVCRLTWLCMRNLVSESSDQHKK